MKEAHKKMSIEDFKEKMRKEDFKIVKEAGLKIEKRNAKAKKYGVSVSELSTIERRVKEKESENRINKVVESILKEKE